MTESQGTKMLTVSRFASTGLLRFFDASLLLATFGGFCTIGSLLAALAPNAKGGMAGIVIVFIGESLIYPTVFSLAMSNLGKHTKRGAGLLCMGVSGGAIFPPMQGAFADARSTTLSYVIPAAGFSFVIACGTGMFFHTRRMAALVEQNAALAPAVECYEEKDGDSVEKIKDKRYEGAIRV